MLQNIYKIAPTVIQNLMVSLFNIKAFFYRYTGSYKQYFQKLSEENTLSEEERLKALNDFLTSASSSSFYKGRLKDLIPLKSFNDIREIPILTKEHIRQNIDNILTIPVKEAVIAKTGGSTGASLQVYFTKEDNQRRFANVNAFRAKYGYSIGKKTAWFSGKSLIKSNSKSKKFWRTDHVFNIRYYSTFHINDVTAIYYLTDILKYKPLYFVGFPSSMYELARFGLENNVQRPDFIKAIFPNAETLTEVMRETIENYFGAKIHDQYGSGEGAPHIFEYDGEYKFDSREGFLEVLDENNQPAKVGRMIVTSYHTKATPLIRYDIGDVIELEEEYEYNKIPKIKRIIGRKMSFIESPETGKINAGNISNITKDVKGIIGFQIIQDSLEELQLKLKVGDDFSEKDKQLFISQLQERIGSKMKIKLEYVNTLEKENSGKFNIIKNNLLK